MVAVEKNHLGTTLSKSRSPVLNPSEPLLAQGGSPDTFVIAKASTQKED